MKIRNLLMLAGKRHSHEAFVKKQLWPIINAKNSLDNEIDDDGAEKFCKELSPKVSKIIQDNLGENERRTALQNEAESFATFLIECSSAPGPS